MKHQSQLKVLLKLYYLQCDISTTQVEVSIQHFTLSILDYHHTIVSFLTEMIVSFICVFGCSVVGAVLIY